jgi:hypothetical protein
MNEELLCFRSSKTGEPWRLMLAIQGLIGNSPGPKCIQEGWDAQVASPTISSSGPSKEMLCRHSHPVSFSHPLASSSL